MLLDGAQGLGRRRVAAEDDQMAPELEQLVHSLTGKVIDHIKGAMSVGRTGIIAQEYVIVTGQQLPDAVENRQPSIARIENADCPRLRR